MGKKRNITRIEKVYIDRFRGLKNIEVDFGKRITVICGKNGTSKSTILGIIAQVFSFRTDYSKVEIEKGKLRNFKTLGNTAFESLFSDHFRFSKEFDTSGSMEVDLTIFDGTENKTKENLKLRLSYSGDREKARPILRGNNDRNITHPLIYLSLERLLPIARREYYEEEVEFIQENKPLIAQLSNQILLKGTGNNVTATAGTFSSLAVHSNVYDKDSISVGEDNTGQIIQALLSFKKLKGELENYHGGMLLIDEADAGLFPAAQVEFVKVLTKMCRELDIQVIMTSHSPILIQEIYNLEKNDPHNYKTVYLTDTFGSVEAQQDVSWVDIEADLKVQTIEVNDGIKIPKVNVYFEDQEALDFFNILIRERKLNKISNLLKNVSLGSEQYLSLHRSEIPEFQKESLIVLDGDKDINKSKFKNILNLPGEIPPDQLLFEFLYNLSADHDFWKNKYRYTKSVFMRDAHDIRSKLGIAEEGVISILDIVEEHRKTDKNKHGEIREAFKNFYKDERTQMLVKGKIEFNPFRIWALNNKEEVESFKDNYKKALEQVLINGKKVPSYKVDSYFL